MHKILTILFLLCSISILAQHRCSRHHKLPTPDCRLPTGPELVEERGGGEPTDPANLRSDTLDIIKYVINLDMTEMGAQQISAAATVDFSSKMENIDWINLDLLALTVDSVTNGVDQLPFVHNGELLQIDLPVTLDTGDFYSVIVYYHGQPETDATWGGFYFSSGYAFNLGVGFDAVPHNFGRVWFPCFDNFVEKSGYEFHVLTQNNKQAYCNGIRMGIDTVGTDSLLTHWLLMEQIPSYLASVAVGDYVQVEDSFENLLGEEIPIWLVAKPVDTLEFKQSLVNLPQWMGQLENMYGLHRFPRVGFTAVPFNGGAMEHATNISYPLFAIDGTSAYETLYAHEIAHHWWGDNITCRTSGDMWINEGWASYSEALYLEHFYGDQAYFDYVRDNHKNVMLHAHQADGGRYPVSPVPENITYGSHVYDKGADVAHTLRGYMGDEDFFTGITAMMDEYAYDDIDSEEMRDFLQEYTDADLTSFFDNWIFAQGFPEFNIAQIVLGTNTIELHIRQQLHYAPELYDNVPMQLTLLSMNTRVDTTVVLSGEMTIVEVPWDQNETFMMAFLNENNAISEAVLGESKMITSNGTNDFEYAEMDVDLDGILKGDSLFVRVENHWAAANDPAFIPDTDYFISPDRFWRVLHPYQFGIQIEGSIRYYGNEGSSNYFDPLFFEYLEENNIPEDSIVLMHRHLYTSEWFEYEPTFYTVDTQGGNTNWTGRIDMTFIEPGDYAWAVRTGSVGIQNSEFNIQNAWFNGDMLNISSEENTTVKVYDVIGKEIYRGNVNGRTEIDASQWSEGKYIVSIGENVFEVVKF